MNSRIRKYLPQSEPQIVRSIKLSDDELRILAMLEKIFNRIDDPEAIDRILVWMGMKYGDRIFIDFEEEE